MSNFKLTKESILNCKQIGQDFIDFISKSVSPFHAVNEVEKKFLSNGFQKIKENDSWSFLKPSGKYFFTRNQSSIVAFEIGKNFKPGNGFKIIGAHTDSPDLRVKPIFETKKEGFVRVNCAPYGGGIWHTWFDRDLSVAGRVIIQTSKKPSKFKSVLVDIKKPILLIPSLCIHLDRTVNKSFKFNQETNFVPIISSVISEQLEGKKDEEEKKEKKFPLLFELIAKELKIKPDDIKDFQLSVYDTQKASLTGAHEEFISSARIDNLVSCYCATESLIKCGNIENDKDVRMVAYFNHEEIGSTSSEGAGSSMMTDTIKRINKMMISNEKVNNGDVFERSIANSFLISLDGAHAIHPNFPEKHESNHKPLIHYGPVLKINENRRYTTDCLTGFLIENIAKDNSIPVQKLIVSNNSPCGSTIGPKLSSILSVKTIDIGIAQWAMHSIREHIGTNDIFHTIKLLDCFFQQYRDLFESTEIGE